MNKRLAPHTHTHTYTYTYMRTYIHSCVCVCVYASMLATLCNSFLLSVSLSNSSSFISTPNNVCGTEIIKFRLVVYQ
jgi:hypothetical protein